MSAPSKTLMKAEEAARVIERALAGHKGDLTVADASAKSGLPLRDADRGLHALVKKYRGHLRATSEGELIFRFPYGFSTPWITETGFQKFMARAGAVLVGVGRFIVRAWIMIVLVGYTLAFVALIIAMAFGRSSSSRGRSDSSGLGMFFIFRILADAAFWTFHPFSPFSYRYRYGYGYDYGYAAPPGRYVDPRVQAPPKEPFYEKVNRFFFGPHDPPVDPLENEKKILAEIRAGKGRIGLADVMRVTGLPREEADPLMSKILLDFDGDVEVSENGGIVYKFESVRRTVGDHPGQPVPPVWDQPKHMTPLTGNDDGANFLIIALNAFNMLMSYFVIAQNLTIHRITMMVQGIPEMKIPLESTPIALGLVPFIFSLALFALPIGRALYRPWKRKRIAKENARLALLKTVLTNVRKGGVADEDVKAAWTKAAGSAPNEKELNREVVKLGGDVDIGEEGQVRYRFPDLEAEAEAVEAEREAAAASEESPGKVVFSSDA